MARCPVQRCTVHKDRDDMSADYTDMVYANFSQGSRAKA
jgi:hypothetical protein